MRTKRNRICSLPLIPPLYTFSVPINSQNVLFPRTKLNRICSLPLIPTLYTFSVPINSHVGLRASGPGTGSRNRVPEPGPGAGSRNRVPDPGPGAGTRRRAPKKLLVILASLRTKCTSTKSRDLEICKDETETSEYFFCSTFPCNAFSQEVHLVKTLLGEPQKVPSR